MLYGSMLGTNDVNRDGQRLKGCVAVTYRTQGTRGQERAMPEPVVGHFQSVEGRVPHRHFAEPGLGSKCGKRNTQRRKGHSRLLWVALAAKPSLPASSCWWKRTTARTVSSGDLLPALLSQRKCSLRVAFCAERALMQVYPLGECTLHLSVVSRPEFSTHAADSRSGVVM